MINQRVFVSWLPIAIATTIILGAVYAVVQQNYRQSANDPQIQLAEDGAMWLKQGISYEQFANGMSRVDMTNSLNTFAIFYDAQGKMQYSSGFVGTGTPYISKGALDAAKSSDINKVTWQIVGGERFAAVIKYWSRNITATSTQSGYVLVARSLREIENRELQLEVIIGIAWIIAMTLSLIAEWFKLLYHRRYIYKTPQ